MEGKPSPQASGLRPSPHHARGWETAGRNAARSFTADRAGPHMLSRSPSVRCKLPFPADGGNGGQALAHFQTRMHGLSRQRPSVRPVPQKTFLRKRSTGIVPASMFGRGGGG